MYCCYFLVRFFFFHSFPANLKRTRKKYGRFNRVSLIHYWKIEVEFIQLSKWCYGTTVRQSIGLSTLQTQEICLRTGTDSYRDVEIAQPLKDKTITYSSLFKRCQDKGGKIVALQRHIPSIFCLLRLFTNLNYEHFI